MDYKFGQKNQWRRWIWNRIEERLTVPKKDALVVYLPGHQDLDRSEALRRGFSEHNLIGVERSKKELKNIRKRGVLCIEGDFMEAVEQIARNRKIDIVFGDFMGGLTITNAGWINRFMTTPNMINTVFAFNLLRGRDKESDWFKRYYKLVVEDDAPKHRGKLLFLITLRLAHVHFANELKKECDKHGLLIKDVIKTLCSGVEKSDIENAMAICESYKSGVQIFDSVVFKNPVQFWPLHPVIEGEQPHLDIAGNVAAIMAHRTMRITGVSIH